MGLRGPLPKLKTTTADDLDDLSPPSWLSDEGKVHWTQHAPYLVANRLLTAATRDSFALCCDLWGRLCEMRGQPTTRAFLDTQKAYISLVKLFRMVPCDKPGTAPERRHEDKDEFDFE